LKGKIEEILTFWFGSIGAVDDFPKNKSDLWFKKDKSVDIKIRETFEGDLKRACGGQYDSWLTEPTGMMAQIILLDQFSRNMFRGKPEAFRYDPLALKICKAGLFQESDLQLPYIYRVFFYLPLEHSEDLLDQNQSIEQFTELKESVPEVQKEIYGNFLEFALRHKKIIQHFGRFPHRNAILGRDSTPEEEEFLKQPGSGF